MVDEYGFPEDDDLESQYVPGDDPESQGDFFNPPGQDLDRDLSLSDSSSSSLEDEEDKERDHSGDQDEDSSPPRRSSHLEVPGVRPSGSSGQGGSQPPSSMKTSGTLSLTGRVKDSRKQRATDEVIEAFSGPPQKRDPCHAKLKETGWTMTQRVFWASDV